MMGLPGMTPNMIARIAAAFAVGLPPVGVVAPKGVVIVLAAAGALGVVAWIKEGRPSLPLSRALIAVLAASAAWCLVASAWAPAPADAVSLVSRLALIGVFGIGAVFLVVCLDDAERTLVENEFLIGMALGAAALVVGFVYAKTTGNALWSTFKNDPLTTLNNGAVTLSLLSWPAFGILWRRGHKTPAVVAAVLGYGGLMALSSGAALVGPVAGLAAFAVVCWFGHRGGVVLAAVAAVMILAAPEAVTLALSTDTVGKSADQLPPSAAHRLRMWAFTVDKIGDRPVLGWGLDSSRSIPGGDRHLAPEVEVLPLHPHNAFLQARLELGVAGAALLAALAAIVFAGAGRNPDRFAGAMTAATAAALIAVASVSYGIWQNWWLAFAWCLAAVTVLALGRTAPD